jgi:hypothetical protein
VLARIRRPLKLVAERIDGTDRRFAPGHELPGFGLGARRVHELRIFSRQAGNQRYSCTKEQPIAAGEGDATAHLALQHDQLMSERSILCFKQALRLEG